jgi:hypothetical protein
VAKGVVYVGSSDGKLYALNARTGALLWSYTTAGGVDSTAVSNGVVYFGSNGDHSVYALNASTGAKLWSYTTGGYVVSSPAVSNGVIYIGSFDGQCLCLRPEVSRVREQAGQFFKLPGFNCRNNAITPPNASQRVCDISLSDQIDCRSRKDRRLFLHS